MTAMQSNDDTRPESGSGPTTRESRGRARRQLIEQARRLANEGRWEEALTVNQQLIERTPRDVDAHNRLGKAYFELRKFKSAYEAYQAAYAIDPANVIAQRNISRIEPLKDTDEEGHAEPELGAMRPNVFIEEVGKTYVDDLVNVADGPVLTELSSGDRLRLVVAGNAISIEDIHGTYIGQLEPRLANKMLELLQIGNEYEVYVTSSTGMSVRVIIRESFKHPSMGHRLSFPRQGKVNIPRAYLRDTRLFRDEPDMLLGDDEDDDGSDDETDEFEATDGDDDDTEFIEESGATIDEDEEEPI
jgi:tetratricopeptide (TPR) repeat protein